MARRRKAPERAEKPNPYRNLGDAELADTWARMLDARADRLEYFAALPEWQTPGNIKTMKDDPEAWGLSRGEFREWCEALMEHWREGWDMANAAKERHRRLYEAERRRVAALPYPEADEACKEAHRALDEPAHRWRLEAETMREYVERVEAHDDQFWIRHGASVGWWDALEERNRERLLTWRR